MPHGHCYLWRDDILWLHVISNALIAVSYLIIPFLLIWFIRKRKDLLFKPVFVLFASFIVSCAISHVMMIVTVWQPFYVAQGVVLAITGIISVATAVALIWCLPAAMKIPSHEDLRKTQESLEREIAESLRVAGEKDKADAANNLKSEFLANMSHEIRTPLNGIVGMLDLIMESDLTADQKEDLEVAQESSQVLLALINDILDLSRIEAGKLSLRETEMSIHDVAGRVVKLLTMRAEAKGLYLKLNISDNVPSIVIGDSSRVAQILTNLIFNAIKFTETGGVTVSIHDEGLSDDRAYLSVVVADTGIGIEADQVEVIFDSFTQAHGDISLSYGGAGLGLAISSRLACQMGGELSVISEVGEGSSFTATLAFGRIEDTELDEVSSLMTDDGSQYPSLVGKHILVVEDNEVNQQLILKILNRRGIANTLVENGQLAVDEVKRDHFDLVLMDIRMPVMDGITATKQIREWEKLDADRAPVIIIALTAFAGEVNSVRAADAGVDDFITKPYRPKELLKSMNRLLGRP